MAIVGIPSVANSYESSIPEPISSGRIGMENTQWGNLTLQTATAAGMVFDVAVDAPYRYLDEDEQLGVASLDQEDFMRPDFTTGPAAAGLPRPDFLHRAPTGWPVQVDVQGAGMHELTLRYEDVPHILAGRDDKSYVVQVLVEYETEDDE